MSASSEGLFDDAADAAKGGAAFSHQRSQRVDGETRRQKVVDEQHAVASVQVFGRDDEVDDAAFGMAWGLGVEVAGWHGDRTGFAGIDDWHADGDAGGQRRGDAADFGCDNLAMPVTPAAAKRLAKTSPISTVSAGSNYDRQSCPP